MFKFSALSFGSKDRVKICYRSSESIDVVEAPKYKETKCSCCGTLLRHPIEGRKFKCTICDVTVVLVDRALANKTQEVRPPAIEELRALIKECMDAYDSDVSHTMATYKHFAPIERYLADRFKSCRVINECFKASIKGQIMDYEKCAQFYGLLGSLPTKRPLYVLLKVYNELLKRPRIKLSEWDRLTFIFLILELPSLKHCLSPTNMISRNPKVKSLCYEVLKRCIGYLGSMSPGMSAEYVDCLTNLHPIKFQKQWETLNIYLSYQFQKMGPGQPLSPRSENNTFEAESAPQDEYKEGTMAYLFHPGRQRIPNESRYKIEKYGTNWHVKTVCHLMSFFFTAHCQKPKCDITYFYNTFIDFIDYKKDFTMWFKHHSKRHDGLDDLALVSILQPREVHYTSICQFPFLLSLGMKIAIMEFEMGKMMEHNAEQAFLKALDTRRLYDVHFKIRVRRSHVTQDSLAWIQRHPNDLKKSLRIEFANEPGIDAGGLKKEWFLLLTRELFHPDHGLFQSVQESRLSWFTFGTAGLRIHGESTDELYYLFGVVLGLAIYNSTILDLHFARALYKKLCNEPVTFEDYQELYPDTAKSLLKMLDYQEPDFDDLFALTFETTYTDVTTGARVTRPLCPDGNRVPLTLQNKHHFVAAWVDFYLNTEVAPSFRAFKNGFDRVIGEGLAFPMFKSPEVERLICGSKDQQIDFAQLRAVTKYLGGYCDSSDVIQWLWHILSSSLSTHHQRQFLHFVTGSDRVPVTGLATLPFKISRTCSGPPNQLPTSHTCFNELCLYEYPSRETLLHQLTTALDMYEGYGFK